MEITYKKTTVFFLATTLILALLLVKLCNNSGNVIIPTSIGVAKQQHIESKNIIDSLNIELISIREDFKKEKLKNNKYKEQRGKYIEKLVFMPFAEQQIYFDTNYAKNKNSLKFNSIDSLQSINVIKDIELGKTLFNVNKSLESQLLSMNKESVNLSSQNNELNKDLESHIRALDDCEETLYKAQEKTYFKLTAGVFGGNNTELSQWIYGANIIANTTSINYIRIGSQNFATIGKNFNLFELKR